MTIVSGSGREGEVARLLTDVMRWFTVLPESVAHERATLPSYADWLALDDGRPVGAAWCVELPDMRESTAAFGGVGVVPEARRAGVGSALLAAVAVHARALGKDDLETIAFADDEDGIAYAGRRGFSLVSRNRGLRLELATCSRPDTRLPKGLAVTTRAERLDLDAALWELAREAMADIPFDGDVPLQPGTLAEFRAALASPTALPQATFVALEGEVVVGYAELAWDDPERGIAQHRMLAVRRTHRGRGVASALKARQIAWALDHGLTELRTANEDRNAAARAVNARFPYTPTPDELILRGPLPPWAEAGRGAGLSSAPR